MDLAARKFPTKKNGEYTKDSLDSLQHIVTAMVPAVMGHFETYQRYLFAGAFDMSVHLADFDVDKFMAKLDKVSSVSIDPVRLSAHRGLGAESIGILLADSLSGWHNPTRVNELFGAFNLKRQLFSGEDCDRLATLWQLRHSIVHTGGTLTLPDAQKVPALAGHGNCKTVFEKNFIYEISRKLHPVVKRSTEGFGAQYKTNLQAGVAADVGRKVSEFFRVGSSISAWLKT